MRKVMLLAAMLALALVAAAPAIAQVSQEQSERRITSGAASPKTEISNKGNNVNLCPTGQQAAQTGNVANQQGAVQYASKLGFPGDIDFSGSELTVTPDTTAECTQEIRQAAAAGPTKAAEAKAPEAKAAAPAAAAPVPAKVLPATGGIDIAPLLGLGAGALLVAGGLLARKLLL